MGGGVSGVVSGRAGVLEHRPPRPSPGVWGSTTVVQAGSGPVWVGKRPPWCHRQQREMERPLHAGVCWAWKHEGPFLALQERFRGEGAEVQVELQGPRGRSR